MFQSAEDTINVVTFVDKSNAVKKILVIFTKRFQYKVKEISVFQMLRKQFHRRTHNPRYKYWHFLTLDIRIKRTWKQSRFSQTHLSLNCCWINTSSTLISNFSSLHHFVRKRSTFALSHNLNAKLAYLISILNLYCLNTCFCLNLIETKHIKCFALEKQIARVKHFGEYMIMIYI